MGLIDSSKLSNFFRIRTSPFIHPQYRKPIDHMDLWLLAWIEDPMHIVRKIQWQFEDIE